MIRVQIDDREVMKALSRLAAAGADMSLAMANIAQVFASESERQFQRCARSIERARVETGAWSAWIAPGAD